MCSELNYYKMPHGKYEGYFMIDIPARYLLQLYDNDLCSGKVKRYIEFNLKELREEEREQFKDELKKIFNP